MVLIQVGGCNALVADTANDPMRTRLLVWSLLMQRNGQT